MIFVGSRPPLHCIGCGACAENGICVQQDAVNEWKKKLEQADGFIITGDIMTGFFVLVSLFQPWIDFFLWPFYCPFTWNDDTGVHFEECDPEGRYLAGDLGKQMNWALGR